MSTINIMLVDDHALVRAGIRSLLNLIPGVKVVAEASDGREALKTIEEVNPHIVIMDIMMPELNGLDATAQITSRHPGTRVIILSMNSNEEYIRHAIRAGASGYLLKNTSPGELEQAIRAVARGETFVTQAVSNHLIAAIRSGEISDDKGSHLTPRQREVLQLVAEGKSTKEVAAVLNISVKTAEGHRTQLMQALDIHDVSGLVRYAVRHGIIQVS